MQIVKSGGQSFEAIRTGNYFYVDKTFFIREWWEAGDDVTLITRPRRFGKTLNMDMLKCFFSTEYTGRSDLFEGLDIWKEEKYRELQGTYPVIFLSFARIKRDNARSAIDAICNLLSQTYEEYSFLLYSDKLEKSEKNRYRRYCNGVDAENAPDALNFLSGYLYKHFGKKVLIFLDEYDTPLQEAYVNGYWDEMSSFIRSLFNSTFKSNQYLERAIMTGITRVSKESIFSDLNNLTVVTTTTDQYETCFGFTQEEVDNALDKYQLSDQKETVKKWYDGFTFGVVSDIYNPWSITQFLKYNGKYQPYWANTSDNGLISHELQIADNGIKNRMEDLLNGGTIETEIDEQIIFSQLETNPEAIWSLFLASGYLKVVSSKFDGRRYRYVLKITNLEVELMFQSLISLWFRKVSSHYNDFIEALISENAEGAQIALRDVLLNTVSFYDTSVHQTLNEKTESFYHGLVLGMIAQEEEYRITSNRESGYGRYDIMMKPLKKDLPGIIIEFKVFDSDMERTLEETAERALIQILEKKYDTELIAEGIPEEKIIHYGMGFRGKDVVIKAEK